MRSSRQYSRRGYAPLTLSCVLVCATPGSPTTQLLREGEYEPDRTLSPCALSPRVSAAAKDGSWNSSDTLSHIGAMKWFVDGQDITTLSGWANGNDYEILQDTTADGSKGTLLVKKNFADGERHSFHFACTLNDPRTGQNFALRSDDTVLLTQSVEADRWVMESGVGTLLPYDVTKDKLLLYDYLASHGIATQLTPTAAKDGCEYLRSVPVAVRKGKTAVTTGVEMRLYRTDLAQRTRLTPGTGELAALSPTAVTLDLRLVPDGATYYAEAVEGGKVVASKTLFSLSRRVQAVTAQPSNGGDLLEGQTQRWDKAVVRLRGGDLQQPQLYLDMKWYADTAFETGRFIGQGAEVAYALADLTIGSQPADAWVEVYLDYDWKAEFSTLTDKDGSVLADKDGSPLIFN